MQAESSRGPLHRFRHYVAFSVVLVYALLWDIRTDAVMAFGGQTARMAWKRAAIWYVGIVALMTFTGVSNPGTHMEGIWPVVFASWTLNAIVTALSVAIIPAVFYLCRSKLSTRSIALATIVIALATLMFAWAVRPLRLVADKVVVERNDIVLRGSTYVVDERIAWWLDFHTGVRVITSALVGIVLARRRGWNIPLTVAGLFATWFLLVMRVNSLGWRTHDRVWQGWKELALNAAMVMIWLTADEVWRRTRSSGSSSGDGYARTR
jgi:hypothetical protein